MQIIDAEGYLIPGAMMIKCILENLDLRTKRYRIRIKAAIAGGITSFIEQPNTIPNAVTQDFRTKYELAAKIIRELFLYDGATNDNLKF
jgi:dihydroorotase